MSAMIELTKDVETGDATPTTSIPIAVVPEPEIGKGFLKPVPETTPMERVSGTVALAAVVTALAAMILEGSTVVILGGILSAIMGPFAHYQQTRLTDIRTLKETEKVLKEQVDALSQENERLAKNVDNLSESVNELNDIQEALKVITNMQGQSVDEFSKQVDQAKANLATMQRQVKGTILQNLLSIIWRGDTNKDNHISHDEVDDLLRRLKNIKGVTVKEDRFRAALANQSIQSVNKIIQNVLKEDVPPEEVIFEIQE